MKLSIEAWEPYLERRHDRPHRRAARHRGGPSIPRDDDGPVFREPWEAQAFAMALALHERGLFTWSEWAATLADEIKRAQAAGDPDTGETYYRHWLNALERLVAEKGVTDADTLHRYRDAWDHAADRTPHGKPIELTPEDFGRDDSASLIRRPPLRRRGPVRRGLALEHDARKLSAGCGYGSPPSSGTTAEALAKSHDPAQACIRRRPAIRFARSDVQSRTGAAVPRRSRCGRRHPDNRRA